MESGIESRVRSILRSLPDDVLLVAAAKTRTPDEVRAAVEAGVTAVGHNYVQEAEAMRGALREWEAQTGPELSWRCIGHLQRNKAGKAVALFDTIETVDSIRLARAIDRRCGDAGKAMPVLIEINSGREENKSGVTPEDAEALIMEVAALEHVRVQGLMTMAPFFDDAEAARPYFRATKELFDALAAADIPHVEMRRLSMGMSHTYRVAIEEGANVVRLGTALFGPRERA